jgi:hypothetical protein
MRFMGDFVQSSLFSEKFGLGKILAGLFHAARSA